MKILLFHAGGQTTFDSEDVLAFGTIENLIASDVLAEIPNREKSLNDLWEAANEPVLDLEAITAEKAAKAAKAAQAEAVEPQDGGEEAVAAETGADATK